MTRSPLIPADSTAPCAALAVPAGSAPKIYWHGPRCYCDHVRLKEDALCPVCDVWPRPEIRTMPNGCRYVANVKDEPRSPRERTEP